jgi:single-strand DNA-binding protein
MMDAKNVVVLQGGLTRDPETANNGQILKLGLAVDYASNDKDNRSGYFDVTYFFHDDPNSKFVKGQLDAGNLKKGSQLSIIGRLNQDRWEQDGQKRSRVIILAEAITYAGRKPQESDGNGAAPAAKAMASSGPPTEEEMTIPPGEF